MYMYIQNIFHVSNMVFKHTFNFHIFSIPGISMFPDTYDFMPFHSCISKIHNEILLCKNTDNKSLFVKFNKSLFHNLICGS